MKLVYGKGYNDLKGLSRSKFYCIWMSMIKRCYDPAYHKIYPTYIDCSVCDEWLTFSNFKAWMEIQDYQDKQLDKDLLLPGNKIYSPETCVFISGKVNNFLIDSGASRGLYPIGVSFHKASGKFIAQCGGLNGKQFHIGSYETPEEAHNAWKNKKHELALEYALQESDERIKSALRTRFKGSIS